MQQGFGLVRSKSITVAISVETYRPIIERLMNRDGVT